LRQLEEEGGDTKYKVGVYEGVRQGVLRQYELIITNNKEAITKNGITKLGAPPALDLSKFQSDKKITDEEVLKILEQPLSKNKGKSKNKKKKKPAKKAAKKDGEEESGDESEE
ncbi:hypothetical protein PC116_g34038, partial [Phytophthora cactorum]